MPTISLQGAATPKASLIWGTKALAAGSAAPFNTAEITSLRRTARSETTLLEDGDGFTNTAVTLNDGDDLEIVCRADSQKNTNGTWPEPGETASILAPGWTAAKPVLITAVNESASRKAAGEISFSAKWFVGFTVS